MKKLLLFALFAVAALMFGCDVPADLPSPEYTSVELSNYDMKIIRTDVQDVTLSLSSDTYTVDTTNPLVATATAMGDKMSVTAVGIGKTILTLKDSDGKRAKMIVNAVELVNLSLALDEIRVDNNGTTKDIAILTGNGDYICTSSDPTKAKGVVEPIMEGDVITGYKLVITGYADADEVVLTITDHMGKTAKVTVEVTPPVVPLVLSRTSYEGTVSDGSFTINITSGNGNYKLTSNNTDVVTATEAGGVIIVTINGDGPAKIIVEDLRKEKVIVDVNIAFDLTNLTTRFCYGDYRAQLGNTDPVPASGFFFAGDKKFRWYPDDSDHSKHYEIRFSLAIQTTSAHDIPSATLWINGSNAGAFTSLRNEKCVVISGARRRLHLSFEHKGNKGFLVLEYVNTVNVSENM